MSAAAGHSRPGPLALSVHAPAAQPAQPPPREAGSFEQQELILATGDWHTGAKINRQQTGEIYEQDAATTRRQVMLLWDRAKRLQEIQSEGCTYTKLHIIVLGDLVDHDHLPPAPDRHHEAVMTMQTIETIDLFTSLCRQTLTIFPQVEVDL